MLVEPPISPGAAQRDAPSSERTSRTIVDADVADLACTWTRWPMPDPDWNLFLARYAHWRAEPVDDAAAPFWRAAAIVKSLHLRTARHTERLDAPLQRLGALLTAGTS